MQVGPFTTLKFNRISTGNISCKSAIALLITILSLHSAIVTAQAAPAAPAQVGVVHVDATPGDAINSFDPDSALGSSIDVLSHDGIDKVYTPHIIQEALSAG